MADPPRTSALRIGPPVQTDLADVYRIEEESFRSPWNLRTFYPELAQDGRFRLLVGREEAAGAVAGYVAFFDLGREYHLIALAVRPDRRRMGFGRLLLTHVLGMAEASKIPVTLEVRSSNEAAIAFYESQGFIPVALRSAYYEDNGEDALVMWWNTRAAMSR